MIQHFRPNNFGDFNNKNSCVYLKPDYVFCSIKYLDKFRNARYLCKAFGCFFRYLISEMKLLSKKLLCARKNIIKISY